MSPAQYMMKISAKQRELIQKFDQNPQSMTIDEKIKALLEKYAHQHQMSMRQYKEPETDEFVKQILELI